MDWIGHVLVAVLAGIGIAITLVEKKAQWPATAIRPFLISFLSKIHVQFPSMLDCTVCTSFWATLVAELYLSLYSKLSYWPCWPLSGFVAIASTWTIIELMNAIDPK